MTLPAKITLRLLVLAIVAMSSCAPVGSQTGKWTVGNTPSGSRETESGEIELYLEMHGNRRSRDDGDQKLVVVNLLVPSEVQEKMSYYLSSDAIGSQSGIYLRRSNVATTDDEKNELARFDRRKATITTTAGDSIDFTPTIVITGRVRSGGAIDGLKLSNQSP